MELTDSQWSQASLPVRRGGLGFRSAAILAPSAFLASAVSTLEIQDAILAFHNPEDPQFAKAISAWQTLTKESPPIQVSQHKQRSWDDAIVKEIYFNLLVNATSDLDKARLMSMKQPHAGDWLLAPPITSVGLRLSDEEVKISAGVRLGALLCQPHICVCGTKVDARGIHGLSCR